MAVRRNSPCPCGSGKKYKKCCLLSHNDIESSYSHAVQLYNSGQLVDALKVCRYILSITPEHKETHFLIGAITYNNGVTLQQRGELQAALEAYSEALKFCPGETDIIANMGNAYYDLGDKTHALEYYQAYLKQEPNDCPISNRAAQILIEQGNIPKAKSLFENVVAQHPSDIIALDGLAKVYEKSLDRDAAIRQYQLILTIEENPDTYLQMLRLLIERGQLEESIQKLSTLIMRYPDNHLFHYMLADAYRQSGLLEEAQAVYHKLVTDFPDNLSILIHWANLQEQTHQLEGAEKLAQRILKQSPDNEEALLLTARIARRQKQLDNAQTLLAKNTPEDGRVDSFSINYYFELGTTLDKAGKYDEAFSAMSLANQLCNTYRNNHFDQAHQGKGFEHITNVLNEEVLKQFGKGAEIETSVTPIFIVGFPRSGTSLLEQILASHSKVSAGDELPFIAALENHYCQTTMLSDLPYPDCFTDTQLNTDIINDMREFYLNGVASHNLPTHGNKLFTDKMPLNLLYLGLIHLLFPKSPILHIHRHPLDVCLSTFFTNFSIGNRYAMNLDDIAFYYSKVMALTQHYKQHLNLNYLELRYEDLATNTETEIRQILKFIGLEWEENCLSHHLTKRISKTASYEQVINPMYTSSINRYQHYNKQLEPIIPALQPLITEFGYKI